MLSISPRSSIASTKPPDFVVSHFGKGGIDFHVPGKDLFLVGRQLVPFLDSRRLGREIGARRHDAHFDLAGQRFLSHLIPALVELALVPVAPLLGTWNGPWVPMAE